jgi:nucleoside-diphosphate-sugar epimerase
VESAAWVVHIAGLTKGRNEADYFRANYDGTVHLVQAIEKFNPSIKRFVFVSSQAAAGPSSDGMGRKESDPPNPLSAYGRSKLAAENFLRNETDLPFTIVRPPAVYGPRDRDVYTAFKMAARGFLPVVGKNKLLSLLYVKNLVQALFLVAQHEAALEQTYFFSDGPPLPWEHVTQLISEALDAHPIKIPVPEWSLVLPAEISGLLGKILKRPMLLNREKILEIKQPYWTVDISKAERELGYRPAWSTEQGIRETAVWYREQGWL